MSEEVFKTELRDFHGRRITFDDLSKKLRRALVKEARADVFDALVTGGHNIRNRIIRSMNNSPKTGKFYFWHGKPHRASSPGNPPRPMSGDLRRSIKVDEGIDRVEVGSIITKPNYPFFLEKGAPKRKLAARPWLEPAFKAYEGDIKRNITTALRRAVERIR